MRDGIFGREFVVVGTEEGGEEPDPADEDPQKPELILWGSES